VADSLGLHLDQCQRIIADPCSLTVINYTPMRPFLLRLNDTGGGVADLLPAAKPTGNDSDAVIGGGAGTTAVAANGDGPAAAEVGARTDADGAEG
jgi:probable phosphoglycerate mutase